MAEVSRATATKLANGSAVVSAIEVQGMRIAQRAKTSLFGESADAPDLEALVAQLGVTLKLSGDGLRTFEAEYLAERTDDAAVRAARDEALANGSAVYMDVKSLVSTAFGAGYASRVGLSGATERRPDLFAAQARNAQRLLATVEPPESRFGGAAIDVAALSSQIDAAVTPLEQALRDLDRESRENQAAMIRRDEAAEHWDTVYVFVANTMVELAKAAGEHALAERLRPTDRRRAGVEGPTDGPEPSGPTTDEPGGPTEV